MTATKTNWLTSRTATLLFYKWYTFILTLRKALTIHDRPDDNCQWTECHLPHLDVINTSIPTLSQTCLIHHGIFPSELNPSQHRTFCTWQMDGNSHRNMMMMMMMMMMQGPVCI